MKRLSVLVGVVAMANSVTGQGLVHFSNYNTPYYPIEFADPFTIDPALSGQPVGVDSYVQMELWGGPGNVGIGALVFIADADWSAVDGYTDPDQVFTLPGYITGQTWTLQLRAVGITDLGYSVGGTGPMIVTSAIGDGTTEPSGVAVYNAALPNGPLVVSVIIPEPTTFTLLGLGSLALVMVRQRR